MEVLPLLLIIKTNSLARVESDCEFKLGLFFFCEKHLSQVCFALLKHELKNRSAMHNLTVSFLKCFYKEELHFFSP